MCVCVCVCMCVCVCVKYKSKMQELLIIVFKEVLEIDDFIFLCCCYETFKNDTQCLLLSC